ncbi:MULTISPECIES: hypothetical protein [Pseudomonas]|uniref:Uncharacterized protein n=1 Tax=Pseudomonas juntendi TaxID=2666183 RepID=A0AAJ5SBF5_9PSED|nr:MULTISPECIES: hypothetical protein [Pseudomonas]MBA1205365.1 hypothetical protein [Pseudomonas capeferrum]WEA23727.1 hypothetical protein PWA60_28625 [Pseudomonas juntendi]
MVKPRSKTAAAQQISDAEANKIADRLADKPYGKQKEIPSRMEEKAQNISVSLPPSMIEKLQDTALANKRAGGDQRTVSAIIKAALEQAGY